MRLQKIFEWHKKQYQLPCVSTEYVLTDMDAFRYCSSKRYFSIVIPFESENNILVEHLIMDYSQFGWTLLGGSVDENGGEDFIDGAYRNARKYAGNRLRLEEFRPIALLENTFTYNEQSHKHHGVAFVARLDETDNIGQILNGTRCVRLNLSATDKITNINNRKVLEIAQPIICNYEHREYLKQEIVHSYRFNGVRHKKIEQDLMEKEANCQEKIDYTVSDFRAWILDTIASLNCRKFLDVACGENTLWRDIATSGSIEAVWVNDIAWNFLIMHKNCSAQRIQRQSDVMFTNNDARKTLFAKKFFDVVLAKNLLHHLYSYESCMEFVAEAGRIGRYLFLIEFAHPDEQSEFGKELHEKYYKDELRESEHCYYVSNVDFLALTKHEAIRNAWRLGQVRTVKGIYNWAILEMR